MLNIWFVRDNHTFKQIVCDDRESMIAQARDLFAEDVYGHIFVRDELDGILNKLELFGRPNLPLATIEAWADKVLLENAFHKMMV